MGRLKPGATYVYENSQGIIYAREFGSPSSERFEIGRTYNKQQSDEETKARELWQDMIKESRTNETLKKAIDECIMIYYLSKNHGT